MKTIDDQYTMVGNIARSHGVNGDVLIIADNHTPHLFDDVDLIHVQNNRGDLFPARIESVRVQQKNNRLSFFVKFEHVNDRNQAEELKNFSIYMLNEKIGSLPEDDEDAAGDYIAFEILDQNNQYIGEVTGVIDNPAHLILEVLMDDQQHILIPFVDEYVRSADDSKKVIRCQNLKQLVDL